MNLNRTRIKRLAGLAGVSEHETEVARIWANRFEWPMFFVALWVPVQWYLEETGFLAGLGSRIGDMLVWFVFVFETVVISSLVHDRRSYLLHNWMNLAIIVVGVVIFWGYTPALAVMRSLRLLLVMGLLLRLSRTWRHVLSQNNFGYTLLFLFSVVLIFGILISHIDPAISDPWQGIWWALVTVSTVGYGDVVPSSGEGRIFAIILIIMGIVLFSLITANVSAYLINTGHNRRDDILESLHEIQHRLESLETQVKEIKRNQDTSNQ